MTNKSKSMKLYEQLEQLINAAPPGTRLPSEPKLAADLGVSRATLREAMRTFEIQGLIRRRQGSGTYVTRPEQVITSGLEVLESIESLAKRIGLDVTMGRLNITSRPATEEEYIALQLKNNDNVIDVSRVIYTKRRPIAYLIDVLPSDILSAEEIENGFSGSVLDFLQHRGYPQLVVSRTDINAITAPVAIAKSLDIQRGDPLLLFTADLFSDKGKSVDHSYSYFLPGYFKFHVVRRVGSANLE